MVRDIPSIYSRVLILASIVQIKYIQSSHRSILLIFVLVMLSVVFTPTSMSEYLSCFHLSIYRRTPLLRFKYRFADTSVLSGCACENLKF